MTPARSLLLVDDRPENLLALEAILEPLGHELVTRRRPARRRCASCCTDDFAVILLDVQMPGMDGFETAELIKQRERTSTIPIIFLTAITKEEQHVFRGYSVGAVDYIFKPFDPEILRSKVAVFVELWEKNRQIREQAEQLRRAGARRAPPRERRALPPARRRDAADRLDGRREGRATYYNRRWFEYTGHDGGRARRPRLGARHASRRPAAGGRDGASRRSRAAASSRSSTASAPPTAPSAGTSAARCRSATSDGAIDFWIGTATDIDDRKRTEEAQRFLLDAGAELSRSLDWRAGLQARRASSRCRGSPTGARCTSSRTDGAISALAIEHVDPAEGRLRQRAAGAVPADAGRTRAARPR